MSQLTNFFIEEDQARPTLHNESPEKASFLILIVKGSLPYFSIVSQTNLNYKFLVKEKWQRRRLKEQCGDMS